MKRKWRLPFLWKCLAVVCLVLSIATGVVIVRARANREYTCILYYDDNNQKNWMYDRIFGKSIQIYSKVSMLLGQTFFSENPSYVLTRWDLAVEQPEFHSYKLMTTTKNGERAEHDFPKSNVSLDMVSPDHLYLPIWDRQTFELAIYSLPTLQFVKKLENIFGFGWAKQGHQFLTYDRVGRLSIHIPGEFKDKDVPLHDPLYPYWSILFNPQLLDLDWSPDGHYLKLNGYRYYARNANVQYLDRIIDLEAMRSWYIPITMDVAEYSNFRSYWLTNDKGWLYEKSGRYINAQGTSLTDLAVLHLNNGQIELIASEKSRPPLVSPDGTYLALDGTIFSLNTMSSWKFPEPAMTTIQPSLVWLSDKQIVATWITDWPENYAFHLAWAEGDGKNRGEILSKDAYIADVHLLEDFGLVYRTARTDAETGMRSQIQVRLIDFKSKTSALLGEAASDFAVYRSPDKKVFAINFFKADGSGSALILLKSDDSSQKLLRGGYTIWSPDSKYFATPLGGRQWQVYTRDGELVSSFNGYIRGVAIWTQCD